jgi:hypothetical protein
MAMTEEEIREFITEATGGLSGFRLIATSRITARWLADREAAAEEARDYVYEVASDGWYDGGPKQS